MRKSIQAELEMVLKDKIFMNRLVFDERYEPDVIYHRDKEIQEITHFLKASTESGKNIDAVGITGTGKTLVLKQMMYTFGEIMKGQKVKCIYINCKDHYTLTKILIALARILSGREKISHHHAMDIINQSVSRLIAVVIILDEVDFVLEKEDDQVLYILSNKPNVSLINISNNPGWRKLIEDQRVLSRMPPNQILFPPYNSHQLFDILLDRAGKGLNPGTYSTQLIRDIADRVALESGDMRIALSVLRKAGELALLESAESITVDHVNLAENRVRETDLTLRYVSMLPLPKQALLLSIFDFWKCTSNYPTADEVHHVFNLIAEKSAILKELTLDTIRVYLTELSTYRLIEGFGGRGRGQGRGKDPQRYKITMDERLFEEDVYSKVKSC